MKDKIKNKLPAIIIMIILSAMLAISSVNKTAYDNITSYSSATADELTNEVRGLWVTYMDLNMSDMKDYGYNSFKEKFNNIAQTAKNKKFNTLIVQVRPFSDALYNSDYFPYSHILSGVQGKNPGYDPLKYMVEYCHKQNLKIEAWVNPYRVRSDKSLKLSKSNPYKLNPELGFKYGGGIYYNPASEEARTLIKNGVREIVEKYDVDGIQFDDYFYPAKDKNIDYKEYSEYHKNIGSDNALTLEKWRIANVNILIADCYSIIHKYNKTFGISPQGNINNNKDLYADVKSWCKYSGYIDYICPQLYFSLENPALKFEDALSQWLNMEYDKGVRLYIGIAGYKTGTDSDSGTWKSSNKILKKELEIIREKNIKGFMFYSFDDLKDERASKEVANLIKVLN